MKKYFLKLLSIVSVLMLFLNNVAFAGSNYNYYQPSLWQSISGFLGLVSFIGMFLLFKKARANPLWAICPYWGIKKQGEIAHSSLGTITMILWIIVTILIVPIIITAIPIIQSNGKDTSALMGLIASSSVAIICLCISSVTSLILNYQTIKRFTNVSTVLLILGIFWPGILGFVSSSHYKG